MRQNFNDLFLEMKPEAQESVKSRAAKLLRAMAIKDRRRAEARIDRSRKKGTAKP
jgi:hypothetical protein